MIVISFDIGMTGAVAFVDRRSSLVVDLVTKPDGPIRERGGRPYQPMRLDGRALSNLLLSNIRPGMAALAVLENVRVRTTGNEGRPSGAHSEGALLRCRGAIETALDMLRIEVKAVEPQTWKRHFGLLTKPKDASREKALALFPDSAAMLARKKDHNRAEALLLAQYGLTELT